MLLRKEMFCSVVRVVFPRQHEVHQKGNEADGQQDFPKSPCALRHHLGNSGWLLNFYRDWLLFAVQLGMDNGPRGLFDLAGLVLHLADRVAYLARILRKFCSKIDCPAVEEITES